ncbi:geraniol 8-hydroxylase-like [Benincasa hispida]|uniref:geraniol 8-hydroxylase-like n=1 Tax=Benincasa hispida TaxID=102211 RepID=UPI0019028D02|nr:geraniol 8-hydroxylase-like [Benincasa hispida]
MAKRGRDIEYSSHSEREMEFTTSCIIFLLFSFLFSLLILVRSLTRKSNQKQLPPGPKAHFLIGNLMEIGQNLHQSLAKLAESYGPIMTLKLGQMTSIVISSPSMAKEVLQTHDQVLCDRTFPDVATVYNHHKVALAWLPVCDLWRTLRKLCNNHMFSHKSLDSSYIIRHKVIQHLVADVRKSAAKGDTIDIERLVFSTTLDMLSNMIFSIDLSSKYSNIHKWGQDFKETVWGIMEEAGGLNIGDFFPILKKMDLQGCRKRMMVHMNKFLDIIDEMIEKRMKEPKLGEDIDMLQNFLNLAKESEDPKFDLQLIKHLILVLFPAGTDTTTSTVEWAMAELLRNPKMLSKAKTELKEVIGEDMEMKESDYLRLPFLQAIIKETLRLHPPAPLLLPHKAKHDTEIIGGFEIPKNAQLLVNVWKIGRDKSVWEDADLFKPERFLGLGSKVDYKGRDFELIPFGSGRRICPGLPLATKMVHWILGSLIHSFHWRLEDGIKPETLNMEEKVGLTLVMAHPPKAIPFNQ